MNKYIVCMDYTYNGIKHCDSYVGAIIAESYVQAREIVTQKIKEELSDSVKDIWIVITDVNEIEKCSFRSYGDGNYQKDS